MKVIKNPKILKKYRGRNKRPEHGVVVLVKTKDDPFCSHLCVYNKTYDEYWRIFEVADYNLKIQPSDVKYWYIDLAGKKYYDL